MAGYEADYPAIVDNLSIFIETLRFCPLKIGVISFIIAKSESLPPNFGCMGIKPVGQ